LLIWLTEDNLIEKEVMKTQTELPLQPDKKIAIFNPAI